VPTRIFFYGGQELQVTADLDEVAHQVGRRGGVARFQRFAGFREGEPVAADDVAVRTDAVAYMQALAG
jgi:hypothetical protein